MTIRPRVGDSSVTRHRLRCEPRLRRASATKPWEHLQAEIAQPWMIVGPSSERPMILAIRCSNRQVVDARNPQAHQSLLVEVPVLVAIAAEPASAVVVPLVGETHCDAVLAEGPDLLDQPIVELTIPLARQGGDDGFTALQELRPITPATIDRVAERYLFRVASVPGILGE